MESKEIAVFFMNNKPVAARQLLLDVYRTLSEAFIQLVLNGFQARTGFEQILYWHLITFD